MDGMKIIRTLVVAGLLTTGLAACADDYGYNGYDHGYGYRHDYYDGYRDYSEGRYGDRDYNRRYCQADDGAYYRC
jgi:hypothetical protein